MDILRNFFSWAGHKFSSAVFKLAAIAFFHTFAVLKFETIIMEKIGAAADTKFMAVFYSVAIAIMGLGCLLFPISKVSLDGGKVIKIKYLPPVMFALGAFVCSAGVLIFSSNLPLMAFSALFCVMSLGYLVAWQFWSMSIFLNETNCSGRVIGIGIMAAMLALSYSSSRVKSGLILFLTISMVMVLSAAITYILWKDGFSPKVGNREPEEQPQGLLHVLSVALMTVSFGIAYGLFFKIYPTGQSNFMAFSYTTHGLTAFLLGFLWDVRKRAYAYLAPTLIVVFALSPICISFSPSGQVLFEIIGWTYGGLFCLLYILPFIDMAPRTGFPELWAACGAITRYLVTGITIIPTALLVEFISSEWIAAINVAIAILLLKLLSMTGNGMRGKHAKCMPCSDEPRDEISDSVPVHDSGQPAVVAEFIRKYELTSAETRALSHILTSEESLKVISSKENVSERTFQRYLSKIYEKTGTKTRAGLVAMYHMKAWASSYPNGKDKSNE